jgi:hypothetical protein
MNCTQVIQWVNEVVDGQLTGEQLVKVQNHLCICVPCQRLVERERQIRSMLRELPVAEMSPGFIDRALAQAAIAHEKRRNWWRAWAVGVPTALAASVALWVVGLQFMYPAANAPVPVAEAKPQEVAMSLYEERTIHLVLDAPHDIGNAKLTLLFPQGIELAEAPGEQELSWETSLHQGKNLLSLHVRATRQTTGELVARLDHDDKSKTLKVLMDARQPQRSGALISPEIVDSRA